jgi:hypothetical protein
MHIIYITTLYTTLSYMRHTTTQNRDLIVWIENCSTTCFYAYNHIQYKQWLSGASINFIQEYVPIILSIVSTFYIYSCHYFSTLYKYIGCNNFTFLWISVSLWLVTYRWNLWEGSCTWMVWFYIKSVHLLVYMCNQGCGVSTQNLQLVHKNSICINNGKPTKMVGAGVSI